MDSVLTIPLVPSVDLMEKASLRLEFHFWVSVGRKKQTLGPWHIWMWNEYVIHWIVMHSRHIGTCCTVTDFSLAAWEQTVCKHLEVPKGIMSYIASGSLCQIDFSGLSKPKPLVIPVPLLEDWRRLARGGGREGECAHVQERDLLI